ncbi:MAG: arylsulfatase [Pseudomonadota bacterium]
MNQRRIMAPALLCVLGLLTIATVANGQDEKLWKAKSPFLKGVQMQAHLEPAIPHPEREKEANAKLKALKAKAGQKPNILVIYVDDMGWGDPGVYGGGAAIGAPTPNIDSLAHDGLMMTSSYSQPACTPTRAAWQTGRLPQRSGLVRPTAAGEESGGMGAEVTIATLLSDAGYMTGMIGKWHLGEAEGQWPTDVGYDEYYGNLGVNTIYHDWRDPNFSPEVVNKPERVEAMKKVEFIRTTVKSKKGGKKEYGDEITLETEPFLEEKYLAWSKDFMKRATKANKPFMLYHAMNRVHVKNYPNPKFVGKSPAGTPYKDSMLEVDYIVGELVKTVKALGQEENTLIVFTSDNGAEEDAHVGGLFTSDAGHQPWRGAKGTTWEGGVRVSYLATWPGMIKAGRVSDGLFDHMDLYNTLARLGGVENKIPSDRYIDGIDQTSWLLTDQDDGQESNREAVFYWSGQDFYGVRWKEFKRMERVMTIGMNPGPSTYGGLFNATKAETNSDLGWFFNLYSDPKERAPTARTWVVAPMIELSMRNKLSFLHYPQAPRGVKLNNYLLGGPAGGTLPKAVIEKMRTMAEAAANAQND